MLLGQLLLSEITGHFQNHRPIWVEMKDHGLTRNSTTNVGGRFTKLFAFTKKLT